MVRVKGLVVVTLEALRAAARTFKAICPAVGFDEAKLGSRATDAAEAVAHSLVTSGWMKGSVRQRASE